MEVETPLLSRFGNPDPMIRGLALDLDGNRRFLRTSPEFPMKRLLAAGCGPVYEMGRVFRGEECGGRHNVEFTMLEWYRPGLDHHGLMDEVEEFLTGLFESEGRTLTANRMTFRDLLGGIGVDPLEASDSALADHARSASGIDGELSRGESLDLLLDRAAADLPDEVLNLVFDFPVNQAALARRSEEDPRLAHRFEAFVGPMELANGYDELCDAEELEQRLDDENHRREAAGLPLVPVDQDLLAATSAGIAPCAGVALGVDRLLMTLGRYRHIQQVINFPEAIA